MGSSPFSITPPSPRPMGDMPHGRLTRWFGLPASRSVEDCEAFAVPFATSWLVSPRVLAGVRALCALWTATVLMVAITVSGVRYHTAGQTFSYFTYLTYWGLCGYFWISAFHTAVYTLKGHVPLASWPRPLQFLHYLLYITVCTLPILVTIVFWSILTTSATFEDPFTSWENISVHALNTVLALTDAYVLSAARAPRLAYLPFVLLIPLLYLCVAYITHATQGFYPYKFLNPDPKPVGVSSHGMVAAYCVAIAVGTVVVFLAAKGVLHGKQRLLRRRTRNEVAVAAQEADTFQVRRQDSADTVEKVAV